MLGAPHSYPRRRLSSCEDLWDGLLFAATQYWRTSCSRYLCPVVGALAKGNWTNGPDESATPTYLTEHSFLAHRAPWADQWGPSLWEYKPRETEQWRHRIIG
jgi:hypothetical protein